MGILSCIHFHNDDSFIPGRYNLDLLNYGKHAYGTVERESVFKMICYSCKRPVRYQQRVGVLTAFEIFIIVVSLSRQLLFFVETCNKTPVIVDIRCFWHKIFVGQSRKMPIPGAQWLAVTLFGLKISMRNNSFVKVADISIAEEDNGAHGFLRRIKGCNRIFIKFRNRIGIEYYGKVIPMTAVNTLNDIPLCWQSGHTGAGSYPLNVNDNERHLHHMCQSYALLHQGETRA